MLETGGISRSLCLRSNECSQSQMDIESTLIRLLEVECAVHSGDLIDAVYYPSFWHNAIVYSV